MPPDDRFTVASDARSTPAVGKRWRCEHLAVFRGAVEVGVDPLAEIASATHTTSLGRSDATTLVIASVIRKYSPNPPGDSGFCPMILRPVGVERTGSELTRAPTGIRRSVSGP
jgi:hypothetical protein